MAPLTTSRTIRYLPAADVARLRVPGPAMADAIEAALTATAAGALQNIPKCSATHADGRLYQTILAVGHEDPAPPFAAVKVVGLSPTNEAAGLPHLGGVIILLDRASGLPRTIMDATWVTAHRTAAITLVAARRLARADSRRIGFVACGDQARAHLSVLRSAFPLAEVTACSRRMETAEAFASSARASGIEARAVREPRDAVSGQDIVVSSVPASAGLVPFLEPDWLEPGAFASLVDLGRSWVDKGFERIEHVWVDDRAQSVSAKRKMTPAGPYAADLIEAVAKGQLGRRTPTDRGVLVFQGVALADLAVAALVAERAEAEGVGMALPA